MPNFALALKEEIVRLARKELKKELDGLKKASASYRTEIAALKRRILALEKAAGRPSPKATQRLVPEGQGDESSPMRFSAKGLKTLRARLKLSAIAFGTLVGVSAQTIYLWERGQTRPRAQQLRAIAALRKMGKRAVDATLEGSAA